MSNLQLKNVQHDFTVNVGEVAVTVRLGDKWNNAYRDALKEDGGALVVDLWQCEEPHSGECSEFGSVTRFPCHLRGTGVIIGAWRGNLIDIPQTLLWLEHEPDAQEWRGLYKSLRRGYGDQISPLSPVTALIYQRLTKTNG